MTSLYLGKIKKHEKMVMFIKNIIISRFSLFDFLSDNRIPITDVIPNIKEGK